MLLMRLPWITMDSFRVGEFPVPSIKVPLEITMVCLLWVPMQTSCYAVNSRAAFSINRLMHISALYHASAEDRNEKIGLFCILTREGIS